MANVRDMGSPAKLGTKSITQNGTYNASSDNLDGFSQVSVEVPQATLGTKSITQNGIYNASSDNLDGYSQVSVNVPSHGVTKSTSNPTSDIGNDGDTYIKYNNEVTLELKTSVTGGYNGGAVLKCTVNDSDILNAVGDSPYNLDYDVKSGSITIGGKTITVTVTPPANSTSALIITWKIDNVTVWSESIMPNGANTSYGYNTIELHTETLQGDNIITNIYYKQSGAWITIGDIIAI